MTTRRDQEFELLAIGGHVVGAAMHGLFALWHWITAPRRFDFWAKFNTVLALICIGSIVRHVMRVRRGDDACR